jgi:hypothetical protein
VSIQLLREQQEEKQLEPRRLFSEAIMGKIPKPQEQHDLSDVVTALKELGAIN